MSLDANKSYRIILVDDNPITLKLGTGILQKRFSAYPMRSGEQLLAELAGIQPDLILLDIEMPGLDGYQTLRQLQAQESASNRFLAPVVFLTAKTDVGSELEGLELGAVDYITKPFSAPLLLRRVENHILISEQRRELEHLNRQLRGEVRESNQQVSNLESTMLAAITDMVEFRDGVTGGHIERTQRYLRLLVQDLVENGVYLRDMTDWDVGLLVASAPLHDTGKIAIPDAILNKPGRLTAEEFAVMKLHVDYGVQAIERIEHKVARSAFLRYAKIIAATHHEKWDGSGYPLGLAGADIPLQGRLMALGDVYDALISERPYKKAFPASQAAEIISEGRGSHFDPLIVDAFWRKEPQFAEIAQRCQNGCDEADEQTIFTFSPQELTCALHSAA
ncbi:MAG: response regulator [Coriobacteriales bacterium]|jgi:putative two-component system response regulator|nr:response regulator [Coriobacteriales bacterium]